MSATTTSRAALAAEIRATIRLAVPLVVAQVSAVGASVIEVLLAGHYDAHVLGAVAIGANLVSIPLMALIGTMYAVPPSMAQLDGAGRRSEMGALFFQALWTGLGLGLLALAAVRWGGPALLAVAGVPDELAADVTAFLRAVSFTMPAYGLFFACRSLSDGLSMPVPTMVFSLSGLVLLAPIGYVLMYGRLGVAPQGAAGTGTAACVVEWLVVAAYLVWLARAPRYRGLGWSGCRRLPDWRVVAGLLRLGVPMGLNIVLEVGLFAFAALAVGRFGEVAAGAHQVALNAAGLAFMIPLGLAQAITVRVGHAAGRHDAEGVRRAGLVGFAVALATQTLSSALMLSFPGSIAALYTTDAGVVAGATVLLGIAGIFQFSDGIQVACNGALRGLKDTRMPLLITSFAYWAVGAPLGLLFGFRLDWRAPGIWFGLTAGLTVAAVLLFARFLVLTRPDRVRDAARAGRGPARG